MKRARRQATAAPARAVAWHIPLLVAAVLAAYANSLSGAFLLDDQASVVQNASIRDLSRPAALLSPPPDSPVTGRPLVNLSFALNYAAGGLDPFGYHVWNIAVHVACTLLAYLLIRGTLDLPRVRARFTGNARAVAFAAALIWAVHPLNSEVLDYVTQRTESMMAAFYLLTVYAAARGAAAPRRRRWEVLAVAACVAGVWCKESIATAPFMVALYDRVFLFASWRDAARSRRALYVFLALTWALLATSIGARSAVAGLSSGVSPWTYLLNQAVVIATYLRLAFWPDGLVAFYGWPQPLTMIDVLPQALLVGGLLACTVVALVRVPMLGFAGAWFFVTLAPASSIVPIATEVGAERRMYLPLLAVVLLAVLAARTLWRTTAANRFPRLVPKYVAATGLAVVVTALGGATVVRNREYSSPLTLVRTIVERRPNGVAHHMLGEQLSLAGRDDEAVLHLQRAVAAGNTRASFQLGVTLFNQGRADDAIAQLEAYVRTAGVPRVPQWLEPPVDELLRARTVLGLALLQKQEWGRAAEQAEATLAVAPRYPEARVVLAHARFGQERWEDAVREYRAYLAARPADVQALLNVGVALVATGRLAEAVPAFRRAAAIDPSNANARRLLSMAEQDSARLPPDGGRTP